MLVLLFFIAVLAPSPAQTGDPAARSRAATQAMNDGRFDDAVRIYRELLPFFEARGGMPTAADS